MNPLTAQLTCRWARALGRPAPLPMALTFNVTRRCNYRCATCRIADSASAELTLPQYEAVFRSLGGSPWWVTFTGGEIFLRPDIGEIIGACCRICRPRAVTIPTNGSFPGRVAAAAAALGAAHPGTRFTVNVSIDAVGAAHDRIRGAAGAYGRAADTLRSLATLGLGNVAAGIGTVLSTANAATFLRDRPALSGLSEAPAAVEIAGVRRELGNQGTAPVPAPAEYRAIARALAAERTAGGARQRLVLALRREYHRHALQVLAGGARLPCYAGIAFAHVMPDGEVWACCVRGDRLGSLPDFGNDFGALWRSPQAGGARRAIAARGCTCTMANAFYNNAALSPAIALRAAGSAVLGA